MTPASLEQGDLAPVILTLTHCVLLGKCLFSLSPGLLVDILGMVVVVDGDGWRVVVGVVVVVVVDVG